MKHYTGVIYKSMFLKNESNDTLIPWFLWLPTFLKIYPWNTTRALSINQCFKCGEPYSNSVTHCKAVLSRSRLALSTKPILGGGFVCFSPSEFSAEAITVPTKVVFTWHCTIFRVKLTAVRSGWGVNMHLTSERNALSHLCPRVLGCWHIPLSCKRPSRQMRGCQNRWSFPEGNLWNRYLLAGSCMLLAIERTFSSSMSFASDLIDKDPS